MSVRRGNDIIAGLPIIDGSLNTSSQRPIANAPVALAINNLNDRIDTIVGGDVYTKTEVDNLIAGVFANLYPVGSLYLGTQTTCPLTTLIPGSTWELVSQDRSIQGASTNHAAGTTIEAGLPNITGMFALPATYGSASSSGALIASTSGTTGSPNNINKAGDLQVEINASNSSSIYGNSTTVQPAAYVTNIWRRTA